MRLKLSFDELIRVRHKLKIKSGTQNIGLAGRCQVQPGARH
jgi:hypothetical protein